MRKSLMKAAEIFAKDSYCKRNQVGAVIALEGRVMSTGFNGTPSGTLHDCEKDQTTHWYVLHAEANAILFAARKGIPTEGTSLYVTMSPCKDCSKLILQAGIKEVFYKEAYRDTTGIDFLKENDVHVKRIK